MLFATFGFFGVIVAVNVTMAVMASGTWTGLVVTNSYVASQEFQANEDAARRQRELGWLAELTYAGSRMTLVVVDRSGGLVDVGEAILQVNRPVGGRDDQILELNRNSDGAYEADVSLARGVWEIAITATHTVAGPFRLHKRITVGGDPS
jgi:nitrogen fixation protein FixH